MKRVIFDTDIGIDDAMALLFLHYSPDVELLAIVTGFGNASIENTTRNALYMKEYFNIGAAVYRGAAHSIDQAKVDQYPDFVHGSNGLGDIEFADPVGKVDDESGAEAIVSLARRHPQQLSIVAVGRMTNLAQALKLCPNLPDLVHEVVVMGGAFGFNGHTGNVTPVAEANIYGDALAAATVFDSGLPLTIVGLDVTAETIANSQFFDGLRDSAGKAGDFIYRTSRHYLDFHERTQGRYECPVHDSNAVAYLLDPEAFTTQEGSIRVVVDGSNKGQTLFHEATGDSASEGERTCRICTAVNADAVLSLYATTLALAGD